MDLKNWITSISKTIDAKDGKAFSEFIAEDGEFRFGNADVVKGRQAIADYVNYFFTMIKGSEHKIINVWKNDDKVIWQGQVKYTRLDEKQVDVNFVNIFYMDGEMIKEYLIYIDNTPLFAE